MRSRAKRPNRQSLWMMKSELVDVIDEDGNRGTTCRLSSLFTEAQVQHLKEHFGINHFSRGTVTNWLLENNSPGRVGRSRCSCRVTNRNWWPIFQFMTLYTQFPVAETVLTRYALLWFCRGGEGDGNNNLDAEIHLLVTWSGREVFIGRWRTFSISLCMSLACLPLRHG